MHQKTLNSHELYTNVYSVIDHYMINILRKYIPVILELPRGTLIRGGTFIWGSTLIMYRRVEPKIVISYTFFCRSFQRNNPNPK